MLSRTLLLALTSMLTLTRDFQDCDISQYPVEFVNACDVPGIPEHILVLKKGAPYMIMHNVTPVLCNGTRVTYHRRIGKLLEVEIASGAHRGEFHFLPRLTLTGTTVKLPFSLRRVQYPLQPCFAMTVHKSQGALALSRTHAHAQAALSHTLKVKP